MADIDLGFMKVDGPSIWYGNTGYVKRLDNPKYTCDLPNLSHRDLHIIKAVLESAMIEVDSALHKMIKEKFNDSSSDESI